MPEPLKSFAVGLIALLFVFTLSTRVWAQPQMPTRDWPDTPGGFAGTEGAGLKTTTGGAGGEVVTVTGQEDFERYAQSDKPYVIRVKGSIRVKPFGKNMKVHSNKTIIGVGEHAELVEGGLYIIPNQQNVIVRNLTIRDSFVADDPNGKAQDYDGIRVDTSHHVWIDHCRIARMGDGLIDVRKDANHVTVSWCVLSGGAKAFGVGWTDDTDWGMTMHHCWLHGNGQRNPSFDNGMGHFYNNLLQHIYVYGTLSRGRARVVVENSFFSDVRRPLIVENTAQMVARGNVFVQTYGDEPLAFIDQPRLLGPEESQGDAFDPHQFYDYKLDDAKDVPGLVRHLAGPQPNLGQAE